VQKRLRRFLIALVTGGRLSAIVGSIIKAGSFALGTFEERDGTEGTTLSTALAETVAWDYVPPRQQGSWARVLALTAWAQERLQYVRESEGEEAVARERDVMIASLGTRTLDENYLKDTGVEDQYVFTPGARITFDAMDEGRDDLEKAVAR